MRKIFVKFAIWQFTLDFPKVFLWFVEILAWEIWAKDVITIKQKGLINLVQRGGDLSYSFKKEELNFTGKGFKCGANLMFGWSICTSMPKSGFYGGIALSVCLNKNWLSKSGIRTDFLKWQEGALRFTKKSRL